MSYLLVGLRFHVEEHDNLPLPRGELIDEPHGFVARLREVDAEIGLDGILAELNCGGKIPQERVLNALKLLCQEVKPRFH